MEYLYVTLMVIMTLLAVGSLGALVIWSVK